MRYTIAGIPVELPDALLAGHFAQALAPFAEPVGPAVPPVSTGSSVPLVPLVSPDATGAPGSPDSPGGKSGIPASAAGNPETYAGTASAAVGSASASAAAGSAATESAAAGSAAATPPGSTPEAAAPAAETHAAAPETHAAASGKTVAAPETAAPGKAFASVSEATAPPADIPAGTAAEPAQHGHAAAEPARSRAAAPEIVLRPGPCPPAQADYRMLDEFDFSDADADCRFGCDAEGYLLEMAPRSGAAPARFRKRFDSPLVTTDFTLSHHPALLRFGLWTTFNLAAIRHRSAAFHSSVIAYRRGGVLFLGESGTGKSTHTRLWREHIAGAELLNDDSPIIRLPDDGEALVCGSPWSGKTPCYRNVELPVKGIVRLSQAPHNRIRRLRPLEALGALLPSVPPAFAHDERLQDLLCEIVSRLAERVPVYHLECLPDADAARLACETVFGV